MKEQKPWTDAQRVAFTKNIEYLYEASHRKWGRMVWYSFVKGVATGLGIFIGGTIVVALLLWILGGLGNIPFLNNLTDSVKDTLEQGGN